jgi:hypothetical protein
MSAAILDAFRSFRDARLLRKPVEVDEYALRKQRERGEQADRLLADPLFVEAFDTVERVYMDSWRASGHDEIEKRERAWTAVQLLADLRAAITKVVRDGAVAEDSLTRFRARQ